VPYIRSTLAPLLVAFALAAPIQAAPQKAKAAPTGPERPTLAVILAIDGLSTEQLLKYRPWYGAGLKRLLDEGHIETKNRYRHINTETGPGHASLGTGAAPRVSGIVANTWFELDPSGPGLKAVYCTDSPEPDPKTGRPSPGPYHLQVDSLGDRLIAASPLSRVVSVSSKDRASIFMAGRSPSHAAYWFDRPTLRFVTSPAYAPAPDAVALIDAFNLKAMGDNLGARFGKEWQRLALPEGADKLPQPMTPAQLGDYQLPLTGLYFPHVFSSNPRGLGEAYYTSPVLDELVADLAVSFVENPQIRLGRRGVTDLLAVSFSSNDLVSHYYGAESEETLDVLRRVDAQIARLLNAFDRLLPGKVVLGFSADHGFSVIPEAVRNRDRTATGGRLVTAPRQFNNFPDKANRMLRDELCLAATPAAVQLGDGWIVSYTPGVNRVEGRCGPARAITKADIDEVFPRVIASLFKEEISEVRLNSQMASWPKDDVTPFLLNDFYAGRSGDAFLVPRRRVLMHWDPARGSGHGSTQDYDTNVPLIFWGTGFKAGSSDADDAAPYDLAVTLGDAIGVSLPQAMGKSRLPGVRVSK
jgi:predicted AlkP superfamily pyrophosphatase or phosphodiesterase